MDLAKIRKKLKEAKKRETGAEIEKKEKDSPPEPEKLRPEKLSREEISPPAPSPSEETPKEAPIKLEEEETSIPEIIEETPEPEIPAAPPEKERGEEAAKLVEEGAGEGEASPEGEAAPENIIEFLHFRLADEDYAFKVSEIEEILKFHNVTPVPRMEPYVMGLSSLRGKVIPLIDLKKRLGLAGGATGKEKPRIVIVNGPKGSIGAWVDLVVDVLRIPESMVQEPPGHLSENEARFIEGIALWEGKFVSIVRTDEALSILAEN